MQKTMETGFDTKSSAHDSAQCAKGGVCIIDLSSITVSITPWWVDGT